MKTPLTCACWFTLLAAVYLSLSLLILQPPRAHVGQWFAIAPLLILQSAVTLAAIRRVSSLWLRGLLLAGGLAITWMGASGVDLTVSSEHFEGYALVLGSVLTLQGILTILLFAPPLVRSAFANG